MHLGNAPTITAVTSTRTWRPGDPAVTALRPEDRAFLVGTGLTPGTYAHLDVADEAETSAAAPVLAYDSATPLVCTPVGVVALEPHGERPVSSSAAAFVASMQRMARYAADVRGVEDEDEALAIVHAAIADLRAIDPTAWADDATYWPIVGQQMVEGML